ncbi:catalase [Verticiella sediminum]|uniref:Catalase n=1 Tax=Verticiella sediminum TaxID=1247510 RepID=A0A556AQ43_9BURK|nr:catalase [Verticiella sediminum]TSH95024.1 catalase [Verticiella sediminum]
MAKTKDSNGKGKGKPTGTAVDTGFGTTDSGPAGPAPARSANPLIGKAAATDAASAGIPYNQHKAGEHGLDHGHAPPQGESVAVAPEAAASTLSEQNETAKTGQPAQAGVNAVGGGLDRVRVDSGGQVLTTNQGVPVADNQNSLKAGLRGPALLKDFILREKITHFDHERIPERIVHARGSGAHGYFECYDALTQLTCAAPFAAKGKRTPVFVRFSTVAGERGSKDTARDVRGFAIKFYTDQGNWDLVGNNIPVFFIQDAMKFPDLIHAVKPEPHHGMPQAASAHDTFWDFMSLMPESTHMIMWAMSDRAIPRSYRMMQGFGVHTFRFVNAEGESVFVKFHFSPKLGTHSQVWDEAVKVSGADPDFHRRDLWEAIDAGEYPEWEMGIQVFDQAQADSFSFDILDATKIIPEELVPVTPIGRLVLDRNPDNFFAETEQVAFCTAHVVPGIDFTNDPLLAGRIHSYVDTQISRLGGPNFHELPINAPLAPVHNNQRDGMHRQAIHRGRVAYEPNSLAGGCPFQAGAKMGFVSFPEPVTQDEVRGKPEKFAEHYNQATLFYRSQSEPEQQHIIGALTFELSKVTVPAVRRRVVAGLRNVDETLAQAVADGLGMLDLPDPLPRAIEPPKPEVEVSPALSLLARPGDGSVRTRKVALLVADGVDGGQVLALAKALIGAGVVVRMVGPHLGRVAGGGTDLDADASLDNHPSTVFDGAIVVDGEQAAAALSADGRALEFLRDTYRHAKTLMAVGAGAKVLQAAGIDTQGSVDGLLVAKTHGAKDADTFCAALALHRHFSRETNPPQV